jgi:hypothetical protein
MDEAQDVLFVVIILWFLVFLKMDLEAFKGSPWFPILWKQEPFAIRFTIRAHQLAGRQASLFLTEVSVQKAVEKVCVRENCNDLQPQWQLRQLRQFRQLRCQGVYCTSDNDNSRNSQSPMSRYVKYSRSFPSKHANTVHTTITHFFLCSHDIRTLYIIYGF